MTENEVEKFLNGGMTQIREGSLRTASNQVELNYGRNPGGGPILPTFMAHGSDLAIFLTSMNRQERLAVYRYFSRKDPFVSRAIELHSEIPLSRLTITPPKMADTQKAKEINTTFKGVVQNLELFRLVVGIARDYFTSGSAYVWNTWCPETLTWIQAYTLPVEHCHVILHPMNSKEELVFFAKPLTSTGIMSQQLNVDSLMINTQDIDEAFAQDGYEVTSDLQKMISFGEAKLLNTDPFKGSFVHAIHRNRPTGEEYGISMIERCLETLFHLENLGNAQFSISGRNTHPKHLISAEGINAGDLNDLRAQVDQALLEGQDYPIVTNYTVVWQVVGSNDRLLNVGEEYNTRREDLATGMGTTREMLTGVGGYGSQRMTLEIMTSQYLSFRETITHYVHDKLFEPVAEARGYYKIYQEELWVPVHVDDLTVDDIVLEEMPGIYRRRKRLIRKLRYFSTLRFTRLTLRDSAEAFDQLFQLFQKGSLGLSYILDIFNIDKDENDLIIAADLGTPRDSTFNEFLRALYTSTDLPSKIFEDTDFADRVVKSMRLSFRAESGKVEKAENPGQLQGNFLDTQSASGSDGFTSVGEEAQEGGEEGDEEGVVEDGDNPLADGFDAATEDVSQTIRTSSVRGTILSSAQLKELISKRKTREQSLE